jgi:hypothetical protein
MSNQARDQGPAKTPSTDATLRPFSLHASNATST